MMGAGLSKLFAPEVKRALSETQWEYIAFGPYTHWTGTRRALVKRGLYEEDGQTLTFLGEAVQKLVLADLPKPPMTAPTAPSVNSGEV
jgi:hypothetical protein